MSILKEFSFFLLFVLGLLTDTLAQRFPSEEENINYLVTFGRDGATSWGDDDFSQTFFVGVPEAFKGRFYIRVYDPDIGGAIDELKNTFDSKIRFSIYGGNEAHSSAACAPNPSEESKSGNLLASKIFQESSEYDQSWYSFGPFNSQEGGVSDGFLNQRIFKIIAEGLVGDDGNLYHYFISTSPTENRPIDGLIGFTYEYSFRLDATTGTEAVTHVYPYITDNVISIEQHNFDVDYNGSIFLYSVSKLRNPAKVSGDNEWASSKHLITEEEKNSTIDVQIIRRKSSDNNIVLYITNQYNEPVPLFSIPIGGRPKYKFRPTIVTKRKH